MVHNRSVLKERRIAPGSLSCFAVAECRGWRWGSVPRRRSAGSVLRSQVGSGEDELSRCCARGLGDRLQCSFRPGPAAAGCGCDVGGDGGFESWVGLRGIGPALAGRRGIRSAPTGHCIPARGETPGMAHNRSVLKDRRIHPGALTCFAVAECRGWRWGSVPRRGSAESVLHSQVGSGEDELSRCCARGLGDRLQCSLRPGPAAASLIGCLSLYGGG
jgi:hypothetical protein